MPIQYTGMPRNLGIDWSLPGLSKDPMKAPMTIHDVGGGVLKVGHISHHYMQGRPQLVPTRMLLMGMKHGQRIGVVHDWLHYQGLIIVACL